MIAIAIVDDKSNIRAAMKEYMEARGFSVLFTCENGADFIDNLKELPRERHPQAVLMDIDMPVKNGIQTVQEASVIYPDIKFLMLTVFDDDDKIFEAIKAGALGYFLKDEKPDNIARGIHEALELGGSPMSPRIARKALTLLMQPPAAEQAGKEDTNLSEREMEILRLLVEGYDYREVADKLFISPHTVRKHIANIYEKLHVSSKVQAVKLALKKRWFMIF
ncbi:MAG: response regulator transcription factor [Bacteroidia bacterium]|nr:response regulator transcription factor [Bacteroidia bacterium]